MSIEVLRLVRLARLPPIVNWGNHWSPLTSGHFQHGCAQWGAEDLQSHRSLLLLIPKISARKAFIEADIYPNTTNLDRKQIRDFYPTKKDWYVPSSVVIEVAPPEIRHSFSCHKVEHESFLPVGPWLDHLTYLGGKCRLIIRFYATFYVAIV